MAISSTQSYVEYTGDSSTKSFSIPFYFLLNNDISVMIADGDGNITALTNGTDFSVTGQGVSTGGTCAMNTAYSDSYSILIYREPPETQETKYYENGKFPAKSHEAALDKLTMLIQRFGWMWDSLALKRPNYFADYFEANGHRIADLQNPDNPQDAVTKSYADGLYKSSIEHADNEFKRTLRVPESSISQLPNVIGRAGRLLAFNNVGQPIAVHTQTDGGTQLEIDLASTDGYKFIGQCNDYSELRKTTPEYSGQKIKVRSSILSWSETDSSLPGVSCEFIYLDWMNITDFPDDGGTLIAAADGKSVWLNTGVINDTKIDIRWFGATNDYLNDSTAAIQAALTAAEFWADKAYRNSRGVSAVRYVVKFPAKWFASATITYNPVLVELDLNGCVGMFVSSGSYDNHPLDDSYPILFYMRCVTPSTDAFIPAYSSFTLGRNGTLLYGTISNGYPDASAYTALPTTNHVMFGHHGLSETLYTALGEFHSIAVNGAGHFYMNGDYAWGTNFWGCKGNNNGSIFHLISGKDNGEKIELHGCFFANNGKFLTPGGWTGKLSIFGGSLDYFKSQNPFAWAAGIEMKLYIDGPHVEFNPDATQSFFDMSVAGQGARLTYVNVDEVLAVPATGKAVTVPFIDRNPNYPEQLVVDNIEIQDASASATFTQNYLLVTDDGLPLNVRNINPIQFKDYMLLSSFLNRKRIPRWQFYFSGSDLLTASFTADSVSITGASGATVSDKNVFLFIPAAEISSAYQFILSLITCTRMDVAVSFAVYTAYSLVDTAGLVSDSDIIIDQPIGTEHLVNMKIGKNSNIDAYAGGSGGGGYDLVSFSRPMTGNPAEGMLLRLWLYNVVEGSTITLSNQTGLITF